MFNFKYGTYGSTPNRLVVKCNNMVAPIGAMNFTGLSFNKPNINWAQMSENSITLWPGDYEFIFDGWSDVPGQESGFQWVITNSPELMFEDNSVSSISQVYNIPQTGAVQYFNYLTIPTGHSPVTIQFIISKSNAAVAAIWIKRN